MPSTTHFNCPTCDRLGPAGRDREQELKNLRARLRRVYRNYNPTPDEGIGTKAWSDHMKKVRPIFDSMDDYKSMLTIDRQALKDHLQEGVGG